MKCKILNSGCRKGNEVKERKQRDGGSEEIEEAAGTPEQNVRLNNL